MDLHAQQLVRLAELMNVGADVVRSLGDKSDVGAERSSLAEVAGELDDIACRLRHIGFEHASFRPAAFGGAIARGR